MATPPSFREIFFTWKNCFVFWCCWSTFTRPLRSPVQQSSTTPILRIRRCVIITLRYTLHARSLYAAVLYMCRASVFGCVPCSSSRRWWDALQHSTPEKPLTLWLNCVISFFFLLFSLYILYTYAQYKWWVCLSLLWPRCLMWGGGTVRSFFFYFVEKSRRREKAMGGRRKGNDMDALRSWTFSLTAAKFVNYFAHNQKQQNSSPKSQTEEKMFIWR